MRPGFPNQREVKLKIHILKLIIDYFLGEAITILVSKEIYHYKQMRKSFITSNKLQKFLIPRKFLSAYEEKYDAALQELKNKIQNEKKKF